ncbi:cysteine desulfurase [Candidatus Woesearchaeota archaeon]|nr:cysteine desulfurase [Candidatus Woesearchaeota archaeon]
MRLVSRFNPLDVRKDFPFFEKGLVYLDTAATAQKPKAVLESMTECYVEHNANVHRGVYALAQEATDLYEGARKRVAKFINASSGEIVFVRNATEAINLVAQSWGRANISKGDVILVTVMEHHSNIVPWQMLAKSAGASLEFVPVSKDGLLDMDAARLSLRKKPKLFAFTHVSNVLGAVNPAKELIALAHREGVPVLLDASQSVPHVRLDVGELGVDFLVFSGHKLYGPHIGVLYAKRSLLEAMEPVLGGGDMIKEVALSHSTWNDAPWKFEAGTPNVSGAVGLAAAMDYLDALGFDAIASHEKDIMDYALEGLDSLGCVAIYGPRDRVGVISFNFGDMHAHDVSSVLDESGVCVRSGHHCAQPLMGELKIPACARMSFGVYTTRSDIDRAMEALRKAKVVFGL